VTFRPTPPALAALAALALAGCGRAPQKADPSATPPPLPADVQSVETVASPAEAAAPGAEALTADPL
jgi:hypothetical protein